MKQEYVRIKETEVPPGVRFDTTRRNSGQMVTVSYGGVCRAEHDYGDPYMRVHDASDRTTCYYRLVGGAK